MSLIIAGIMALGLILFVLAIVGERAEKARSSQETFESTMRALEEKAKKDGTFRVSYFD